MTTCIRI
jgi:hypothetical protein